MPQPFYCSEIRKSSEILYNLYNKFFLDWMQGWRGEEVVDDHILHLILMVFGVVYPALNTLKVEIGLEAFCLVDEASLMFFHV